MRTEKERKFLKIGALLDSVQPGKLLELTHPSKGWRIWVRWSTVFSHHFQFDSPIRGSEKLLSGGAAFDELYELVVLFGWDAALVPAHTVRIHHAGADEFFSVELFLNLPYDLALKTVKQQRATDWSIVRSDGITLAQAYSPALSESWAQHRNHELRAEQLWETHGE